jgi:hypothetical protein
MLHESFDDDFDDGLETMLEHVKDLWGNEKQYYDPGTQDVKYVYPAITYNELSNTKYPALKVRFIQKGKKFQKKPAGGWPERRYTIARFLEDNVLIEDYENKNYNGPFYEKVTDDIISKFRLTRIKGNLFSYPTNSSMTIQEAKQTLKRRGYIIREAGRSGFGVESLTYYDVDSPEFEELEDLMNNIYLYSDEAAKDFPKLAAVLNKLGDEIHGDQERY